MPLNRRVFLQQVGLGTAGLGLFAVLPGCRTAPGVATPAKLPRSSPETQGVSTAGILAFIEAVEHSPHELHSLMLVRHGHVVAEGWWAPYGPQLNHTLYSLSKSFTSTAVGFAVAEARLQVEDKVLAFFPKELPKEVGDNLAALRIKDLLTMSVGHTQEPTWKMVEQEDWARAFLAWPVPDPPGTHFLYNSAATYMLSAIVQEVTGQRVLDYLRPRLFEPLGITGETWETCPRGVNTGGWGLSVPTEALARTGQLYLEKGAWQDRQLLPARWVAEATTFKIQQPLPAHPTRPTDQNDWVQGYGYQFWRCTHNAFRGDGAFGQFMVVMPEQDAVVAITAETKDMQTELDLVWKHLLPALQPGPLPRDRAAETRLQAKLASLALVPPAGQPTPPQANRISGHTFELENNELGLRSATFAFGPSVDTVTFKEKQTEYPLAVGHGRLRLGETALPGTPPRLISGGAPKPGTRSRVAASGRWVDANTFELLCRYYETPHHDTVTCRFEDDRVQISFLSSIAALSPTPKDKRPLLRGKLSPAGPSHG